MTSEDGVTLMCPLPLKRKMGQSVAQNSQKNFNSDLTSIKRIYLGIF